ncbi:hypothetical protein FB45DRAFT_484618 [Roridomyces roridus]|uniref:SnoaL-like domain-containing protein n=1 Tax=Roridomyces roridus TaxID=1738132 RepID=A0AAD7C0E7_9AGAR|nr:hypothetical protein FB45DRAFT_484618 [Roridomyces roridus]
MSTLAAKQLSNAHAFLEHLGTPNFDAAAELLAANCTHELFPGSFPFPGGQAKRNKEELLGMLRGPQSMFQRFKFLPPLDVIQGVDVIVFHVKSDHISKQGKAFYGEYMLTFRFVGDQIVGIREFCDSQYVTSFFADTRDK